MALIREQQRGRRWEDTPWPEKLAHRYVDKMRKARCSSDDTTRKVGTKVDWTRNRIECDRR